MSLSKRKWQPPSELDPYTKTSAPVDTDNETLKILNEEYEQLVKDQAQIVDDLSQDVYAEDGSSESLHNLKDAFFNMIKEVLVARSKCEHAGVHILDKCIKKVQKELHDAKQQLGRQDTELSLAQAAKDAMSDERVRVLIAERDKAVTVRDETRYFRQVLQQVLFTTLNHPEVTAIQQLAHQLVNMRVLPRGAYYTTTTLNTTLNKMVVEHYTQIATTDEDVPEERDFTL